MCLYGITTDYNGPLEAAHAPFDGDTYDLVECGAAGQPTLDLSHQLRGCSIASTDGSRLSGTNERVLYHRRLEWASRSGSCPY